MIEEFQRLGEKQLSDLDEILSLIDKYKTTNAVDEKNALIRLIAVRHVVTKGILVPTTVGLIHPKDVEYVKEVDRKINEVLIPVYEQLHKRALEHVEQWFLDTQRRKGSTSPRMYKYQKRMIGWILWAVIANQMNDVFYTLLVSRGGSKSFSFSITGTFLSIFHRNYVLHNNVADYVLLCTSGFENQLAGFRKYFFEFLDLSTTTDDMVGLIGRNPKDDNMLGLYFKYKSQDRIEIAQVSGGSYSTIYFCLGSASSIEGKHCNLLLVDEAKFLNTSVIYSSIAPTAGGRGGQIFFLSSASKDYCEFQKLVFNNIITDMDEDDKGIINGVICKTRDGSSFDKTRVDNVQVFEGKRCFIQNWREMILENNTYALTIHRAKQEGENSESFKTQYENMFLSTMSSTFFDPKTLSENYPKIFEDENVQKYLNNPMWTIIAGWDISVTGDNSVLIIKAVESSYGQNRVSKVLFKFIMNPSKSSTIDAVLRQCEAVSDIIMKYKIKAIAIDESGVGKSAGVYIKEILLKQRYYDIDPEKIFPVVFTSGNRSTILDFYYNRIQSNLERFGFVDKEWYNEDFLKPLYINATGLLSEEALDIMFIYEHMKFSRVVYKDEKTGMVKVDFRQAELNFLHDDMVFSSALCSWLLNEFPDVINLSEKVSIHSNNGIYKRM